MSMSAEPQGSPAPNERPTLPPTALVRSPDLGMPQNKSEVLVVHDENIPTLDTAKFQHMYRVAQAMAQGTLVPKSLQGSEPGQTIANCFRVVNQAVRWNMDPFALLDCASIIKGKLCWEGKVIAAVLDENLGVRLKYKWDGAGDNMKITITGTLPDGDEESLDGTVGEWKTTGDGSPWVPKQYRKMLAYRGAREWARLYAPGVMLGVYTPDEMSEARETRSAEPRIAIPPPSPPPGRKTAPIAVGGKSKLGEAQEMLAEAVEKSKTD